MPAASEDDDLLQPLPSYLREPPEQIRDAPLPGEYVLPFERITPPNFERLCLATAERQDCLEDARLYGAPGQKQHGIDLYGKTSIGYADYQVRRLADDLTAAALRTAVNDFVGGPKPFDARRFVVCYARPVRDTKVLDELHKLRVEHADLDIGLWDGERFTRVLRGAPTLVETFFNREWRETIYGPLPAAPGSPIVGADATAVEALIRGPLRVLGLEGELEEAGIDADLGRRAARFEGLAHRLQKRGFPRQAVELRSRQALVHLEAGNVDDGARILLELAEDEIDRGGGTPRPAALFHLHQTPLPEPLEARRSLSTAMITFFSDPRTGLQQLELAAARLHNADPAAAPLALTWLGEAALTARDDAVLAHAAELAPSAVEDAPPALSIRLQLIVANSTGDWDPLIRDAQNGFTLVVDQGIVWCRYGRWLAAQGRGSDAVLAYRRAVDPLARAAYGEDLKECFYSCGTAQDMFESATSPLPLDTSAPVGSRLPTSTDNYTSSMEDVVRGNWASAHADAWRALHRAVCLGNLHEELAIRQLLADIYVGVGEPLPAMRNYLLCGRGEEAAAQAMALPSAPDLSGEVATKETWVLAAALHVLANDADRRSDAEVAALLPRLEECLQQGSPSRFAPQISVPSFEAICALSLQLPGAFMSNLRGMLSSLIDRAPNSGRRSDRGLMMALELLERYRPSEREWVRELIVRCLPMDGIGRDALGLVIPLVLEDGSIRGGVIDLAVAGSDLACWALIFAEVHHEVALKTARQRLDRFLAPAAHVPGRIDIGHLFSYDAAAAALLPDQVPDVVAGLLERAESAAFVEMDRADAVQALASLCDQMGDKLRATTFERVLGLCGSISLGHFDDFMRASLHRLSFTRINLGVGHLPRAAMLAAVQLAVSPAEMKRADEAVASLLASRGEDDRVTAARGLLLLPQERRATLPLTDLAQDGLSGVRAVAAVLWCQHPQPEELGDQLMADDDVSVRLSLARELVKTTSVPPAVRLRLIEHARCDPSSRVRAIASSAREPSD